MLNLVLTNALAACEPSYCKEQDKNLKRDNQAKEDLKEYERKFAKARQVLYQSVSRNLRPAIASITDPKEIYTKLKNELDKKTGTTNLVLKTKLDVPWQWGSTDSWDANLANWVDIITQLKENNATLDNQELNNQLKNNLPQEELAVYLESLKDKMEEKEYTHDEFLNKVRMGVHKKILRAESTGSAFRATQAGNTNRESKRHITCSHCKRPCHSEAECWDKHPNLRPKHRGGTKNNSNNSNNNSNKSSSNNNKNPKLIELEKKIAELKAENAKLKSACQAAKKRKEEKDP